VHTASEGQTDDFIDDREMMMTVLHTVENFVSGIVLLNEVRQVNVAINYYSKIDHDNSIATRPTWTPTTSGR
jgi:hypothetical protein